MAKNLDHSSYLRKGRRYDTESKGRVEKIKQSIEELKKEIDSCSLCCRLDPGYCYWHENKLEGFDIRNEIIN